MQLERRRKSKKERIMSLIVLFLAIRLVSSSWLFAAVGVALMGVMLIALGNKGLPAAPATLADKDEQANP